MEEHGFLVSQVSPAYEKCQLRMATERRQTTVWLHEEENIFQASRFKDANFWIGLRAAQNCFCFPSPSPTSNNATSGAARSVGPFRAPLDLSSLQEPRGAARTRCPAQLGFRRRCRRAPRQENVACCCIHRSTTYILHLHSIHIRLGFFKKKNQRIQENGLAMGPYRAAHGSW